MLKFFRCLKCLNVQMFTHFFYCFCFTSLVMIPLILFELWATLKLLHNDIEQPQHNDYLEIKIA